jgi:hypothetical protein
MRSTWIAEVLANVDRQFDQTLLRLRYVSSYPTSRQTLLRSSVQTAYDPPDHAANDLDVAACFFRLRPSPARG